MRNPAELALRRPRVVVLTTILLVLFGALSYLSLPRQENPTIEDRHCAITTFLPGSEPEKVELLITKVLEEKIAEVDDIEDIFSTSSHGVSWIMLELEKSAPIGDRFQQIRDKAQEARSLLPATASEPQVDTEQLRTNTIVLAVTGDDVAPLVLRKQAKEFKRALENLAGVRRVRWVGQPVEELDVQVDLRKLSQKNLTLPHVVSALSARNILLPGGELDMGTVTLPIRTTGAYTSAAEVGATYLGAAANGLPIRLADVATVQRGLAEQTVRVRTIGVPAIALAVEMLPRRSAILLGERVSQLIAEWEPSLPEGVRINVIADEPTYVRDRITLLTNNLLVGMSLVVALIILGMGWRSGAIVSISIPLSLIIAMGGLSLAGIALHQISIAALVIAVGLVVDEAIVVSDNIQRHLDEGASPREAAIQGLGEIHTAILAGAATTVAAFIPLALMGGDIGDFIRSIPIAVSIMLLASVSVAHFFTPLFATGLHSWARRHGLRARKERHRFEPIYRRMVNTVCAHTRIALLAFVGAFSLTIVALGLMNPIFFPTADRHQFLIRVWLPSGSPVEETEAAVVQIERRLAETPEVADWTAFVGADAPKFYYNEFEDAESENKAMIIVNTKDSVPVRATAHVVARLDAYFSNEIVGAQIRVKELQQGYGGGADIEIYVLGDDLEVLRDLGVKIRDIAKAVPGTVNVRDSFGYDPLTLEAKVDDAKANLLGITHLDVATTLRTAIDGVVATTFREDDEEIDIRVRQAARQRRDVADLETLQIFSPKAGRTVPLSHVASLTPTWTTRYIQRYGRQREAEVSAEVEGRNAVEVTRDIERAVNEQVALPPGYSVQYFGEIKEIRESFLSLARAALVAVFFIYIILVVQFDSLAQPLLIVMAIPMALIGAVWGLILTGQALGFMSFLGMIALTGIVVNDSIVLLDYINTLRRRGYELDDAVITGATTRLRPVILTTVTTIGGLLPLSLTGGAFWAPFGFAMIFGLAASTLLTLLVQPAAYLTLARFQQRRGIGTLPGEAPANTAAAG